MSVYLIIIVVYFSFVALVSVLTKKVASRSAADYLIAGRNLGLLTCSVVIAAEWLGGMSTIGVSEKAFLSGTMQPVLYNISTAAGMIIIGFTVASHYRKNNVHTVSEMIERIFGRDSRNVSIAKRAAVLSALIIAPFGIMVAILGLIARTGQFFDPAMVDPKLVLPTLMTTAEFIHPVLGGIAIAGILAAILSTVGPVNFAIVTIATKDIYHGMISPGAVDQRVLSTARKLVIIVNLITIPLALLGKDGAILDTAYVSYGIRAIGAIVMILGIYAGGWVTPVGVRYSFILGTMAVIANIMARRLGWFTIEDTYVAVAVTLLAILIFRNKQVQS